MPEDIRVLTADMIAALRCPICHQPLTLAQTLRCQGGHSFDIARQGYVNLGTGARLPSGDTAAMVMAREVVQSGGLFAPLEAALSQKVPASARLIADFGAGTGHYLSRVLDERPQALGLAFDVSKPALRRAARAHERMGAILADTWKSLPLKDSSADVILNVFAPRNGPEMRRVLAHQGILIVAAPAPGHLRELREAARLLEIDPAKQERLLAALDGFDKIGEETVGWRLDLSAAQADSLILMGPNAFHGFAPTGPIVTRAEVTVTTWTGRPLPNRPADRDWAR
jgi:23S rRNA (guanine745-N1)-methyltransferase